MKRQVKEAAMRQLADRLVLAVIVATAWAGGARAAQAQDDDFPLPAEVVKAWRGVGAMPCWMYLGQTGQGSLRVSSPGTLAKKGEPGDIPGFVLFAAKDLA